MELAPQSTSMDVLREKYCKGNEQTTDEVRRRVAHALASIEQDPPLYREQFLDAQRRGVIMAGRINSAAGTDLDATLINCFVQPVADSIAVSDADGAPGIFVALKEAAETMRRGGGVGYDFSRIRPRGAFVGTTKSEASGPVSYMEVFDRACQTVQSAGARRGAQMGILRVDHPDVLEFVRAKDTAGVLTNFNLSIAVTDEFMKAVESNASFDLVHRAAPGPQLLRSSSIQQRADGQYVYKSILARELWDEVMRSTYDHGEPGVVFIDRVNRENNLYYCESIEATNPCAEEPLPSYGCCCLGSINLTMLVRDAFTTEARFDFTSFAELIRVAVRMLDNVLEVTYWPLEKQRVEAHNKRRVGLGFLGLGDALVMLGIRYDSDAARQFAAEVSEFMRDVAYEASIILASQRGAFPLFDADKYLAGEFAKRLPARIRDQVARFGIRNSHLLAIAPTGTISLAFADNASNGIEPAYEWVTKRRKRSSVDSSGWETIEVMDHAYRIYGALGRPADALPPAFVSALHISAKDHARMVAAIQPFIDASISKTVNIPSDYPFEEFKELYSVAWNAGAKSLATFRPNDVTGSILGVKETPQPVRDAPSTAHQDVRIVVEALTTPTLYNLRWPRRPVLTDGNPAHCYMVKHPTAGKFALFVGHIEDGTKEPFEVWVNGMEAPRGLNALAINLSYDMYAKDRGWLRRKLEELSGCLSHGESFDLPMPPDGQIKLVPSMVAAMATLIRHRCDQLGAFDHVVDTPVLNALMTTREPQTGPGGTMSWTVDVRNENTNDVFTLVMRELEYRTAAGTERRPYAVWLAGHYPRALDGLCLALSLDMRVIDPAWIGKKLRELLHYPEADGQFWAADPVTARQRVYPSTVAYVVRLILHRFTMLGILGEDGTPVQPVDDANESELELTRSAGAMEVRPGARCLSCGDYGTLRRVDGCSRCSSCGATGDCG